MDHKTQLNETMVTNELKVHHVTQSSWFEAIILNQWVQQYNNDFVGH